MVSFGDGENMDQDTMKKTIECYEEKFGELNEMLGMIHHKLKKKDEKINLLENYVKGASIPSDLFVSKDD